MVIKNGKTARQTNENVLHENDHQVLLGINSEKC